MNEYDLFDAFGTIDDELLKQSEHKTTRRFPFRKALIAAAAVMALAVTAMASPAVRAFLSAKGSELVSGGFYITLERLGIVEQYVDPNYEIELNVPDSPEVPEYIQDFRVPTYFVKNGWIMDHVEISHTSKPDYAGMLFFEPDNPVPQVSFQQHIFYPSEDPDRLWYFFSINGKGETGVTEERITIGDAEATLYNGHTIIWTDGQYAYELIFHYDAPVSEIEEAVLSLESVDLWNKDHAVLEDVFSDAHKTPIETFYTLGKIPEDFTLTLREWNVNNSTEWYSLDYQTFIVFSQCVNQSEENLGPVFSVEGELLGRALDQCVFTAEEYPVDGIVVTIFREADGIPKLMWHRDNYCFDLYFSYDPGLTDEELLDFYRSVQPMADFTDHLTE